MKVLNSKKLISSGIALSLVLGGGLAYGWNNHAFAADNTGSAVQQQTKENAQSKDKGQRKQKAEELKANGKQNMKQNHMPPMPMQGGHDLKAAADALSMEPKALEAELQAGKSLTDVALEKGITEDALIAKLTAASSQKLDDAVTAGKLTADQTVKAKQRFADNIKQLVEHKGPFKPEQGMRQGKGFRPQMDKVAELIGITKEDIEAQLKAGKSLADIALDHGISKDQLVAKLKDQLTPMLEKIVDHKGGRPEGPPKSPEAPKQPVAPTN
jgi:lambda repressor-like predicted transcriptional regulator